MVFTNYNCLLRFIRPNNSLILRKFYSNWRTSCLIYVTFGHTLTFLPIKIRSKSKLIRWIYVNNLTYHVTHTLIYHILQDLHSFYSITCYIRNLGWFLFWQLVGYSRIGVKATESGGDRQRREKGAQERKSEPRHEDTAKIESRALRFNSQLHFDAARHARSRLMRRDVNFPRVRNDAVRRRMCTRITRDPATCCAHSTFVYASHALTRIRDGFFPSLSGLGLGENFM